MQDCMSVHRLSQSLHYTGNYLCEGHDLSLLLLQHQKLPCHIHYGNLTHQMMLCFLHSIHLHLPSTLPMSFLHKHMNTLPLYLPSPTHLLLYSMCLLLYPPLPGFPLLPVHFLLLSMQSALPSNYLLYSLIHSMLLLLQLPAPMLLYLLLWLFLLNGLLRVQLLLLLLKYVLPDSLYPNY